MFVGANASLGRCGDDRRHSQLGRRQLASLGVYRCPSNLPSSTPHGSASSGCSLIVLRDELLVAAHPLHIHHRSWFTSSYPNNIELQLEHDAIASFRIILYHAACSYRVTGGWGVTSIHSQTGYYRHMERPRSGGASPQPIISFPVL